MSVLVGIAAHLAANSSPKRGRLNINRAVQELGYDPQVNVEEGFRRYYNWFQRSHYWQSKL